MAFAAAVLLTQSCFSGADNSLRPVGDQQLGEDIGDVVADGLGLRYRRSAVRFSLGYRSSPDYRPRMSNR